MEHNNIFLNFIGLSVLYFIFHKIRKYSKSGNKKTNEEKKILSEEEKIEIYNKKIKNFLVGSWNLISAIWEHFGVQTLIFIFWFFVCKLLILVEPTWIFLDKKESDKYIWACLFVYLSGYYLSSVIFEKLDKL